MVDVGDKPATHRVAVATGRIRMSPLTRVAVEFALDEAAAGIECTARVETRGPTGVEMEALTAVQIGLLTIYDMVKSADRAMVIEGVRLLEKHGGKSGSFVADAG